MLNIECSTEFMSEQKVDIIINIILYDSSNLFFFKQTQKHVNYFLMKNQNLLSVSECVGIDIYETEGYRKLSLELLKQKS